MMSLHLTYAALLLISLIVLSTEAAVEVPGDQNIESGDVKDVEDIAAILARLQQQIQSLNEVNTVQSEQIANLMNKMTFMEEKNTNLQNEVTSLKEKNAINERQTTNQLDALADENGKLSRLFDQIISVAGAESAEGEQTDNERTTADDRKVTLMMENPGGVSYIRWGRTWCENEATVVYNGYAASSAWNIIGGTSDVICLHSQPQFNYTVKGGEALSILTGVQYHFNNIPFSAENNGGQSLYVNDMPCAVCHLRKRSHQLMIPGRNTCPSGWIREYWGFIVSPKIEHYRGSTVCVDNAPETVPGGAASVNAFATYPMTTKCAALPCPPYVADYEISCVVCSK